jgi:hypothetical protein
MLRVLAACGFPLLLATSSFAAGPVIVHEWGTFTSLQDADGKPIGGINVDDEPAPNFVYPQFGGGVFSLYSRAAGNLGLPPLRYNTIGSKGWPQADPQVTMRLETPVLYIYPSEGSAASSVPALDVHVDFRGGILSQFYPFAHAEMSGGGMLTEQSQSSLTWSGVRIGSNLQPVVTNDHVWTTPREVSAPVLEVPLPKELAAETSSPQAEHFLFYRGVGHLDSPVQAVSQADGPDGQVSINLSGSPKFSHGWLAEIDAAGAAAFEPVENTGGAAPSSLYSPTFYVTANFSPASFSSANLGRLQESMREALVGAGLYPDEASAMLRTWDLSYFKSPGRRFFYIVPSDWVNQVLPLKVSGAETQVTRVMVGRIELISGAERAALARLAAGPCPDLSAIKQAAAAALANPGLTLAKSDAVYRGEAPLSSLGVALPPLVQDYFSLGRFRDALIVHEQVAHPSPALAQFIQQNGLRMPN